MSDVEEALTHKIGPLPGWAWAGITVGCVWGVYLWRKHNGTVAVAVTPVADASGVMPSAVGDAPGTNTGSGYVPAGPMSTNPPTNTSWAKTVADSLIASGSNPTDTQNALANYLNGNSLDTTQQGIINTALRQYGTAPEGVQPVNTAPPQVGHVYTVQQGDTWDSINQAFYNRTSALDQRIIQDSNPGVSLAPGKTLFLPTTGVAGVQTNTLNYYDQAPPAAVNLGDLKSGYTVGDRHYASPF